MLRVKPEALLLICRVLGHMGPLSVSPGFPWMLCTQAGTECSFLCSALLSPSRSFYQASWVPITSTPHFPCSRGRLLQIQEGLYDKRQFRLDDVQIAGHGWEGGRRIAAEVS